MNVQTVFKLLPEQQRDAILDKIEDAVTVAKFNAKGKLATETNKLSRIALMAEIAALDAFWGALQFERLLTNTPDNDPPKAA